MERGGGTSAHGASTEHHDKSKYDDKSERKDPTSDNLYLYEFNMKFFDNGDPEEFFVCLYLQHDSRSARKTGYGSEVTISFYACPWRIVASV